MISIIIGLIILVLVITILKLAKGIMIQEEIISIKDDTIENLKSRINNMINSKVYCDKCLEEME